MAQGVRRLTRQGVSTPPPVLYQFRDTPLIIKDAPRADPQKIGEAIEAARQHTPPKGDLREVLHEHAKVRTHPMHRHLEWDDEVAGYKYRLEQISHVIRLIRIVGADTDEKQQGFISVVTTDFGRARYTPNEIATSGDLQMAVLKAAERDLLAFQRRYRWLSDICEEIDSALKKIRAKRHALGLPAEKET